MSIQMKKILCGVFDQPVVISGQECKVVFASLRSNDIAIVLGMPAPL